METKELKIQIPEGYEIDKEKSTLKEIVFKKKNNSPKSWKEYCELESGFDGAGIDWNCGGVQMTGMHHRGKAIVPTELAAPFIAMMQLMSLRQEWIGEWEPVWDGKMYQYCIIIYENKCTVEHFSRYHYPLSFPTQKMANNFMKCFHNLLDIAKPLL